MSTGLTGHSRVVGSFAFADRVQVFGMVEGDNGGFFGFRPFRFFVILSLICFSRRLSSAFSSVSSCSLSKVRWVNCRSTGVSLLGFVVIFGVFFP
jgi:hypothetical protein